MTLRAARFVVLGRCAAFLAATLFVACYAETSHAQKTTSSDSGTIETPSGDIIRVEEDWELIISTPNPNVATPQLNCVMSPYANPEALYSSFELNHKSLDQQDSTGGMQIQLYRYEQPGGASTQIDAPKFATAGEVVTWTHCMEACGEGSIKFKIVGGGSTTWGDFGKESTTTEETKTALVFGTGSTATLEPVDTTTTETKTTDTRLVTLDSYESTKLSYYNLQSLNNVNLKAVAAAQITNLNQYDPNVSVQQSGISYGANVVSSFKLKRVRKVTSTGEIIYDNTERVIYQASSSSNP